MFVAVKFFEALCRLSALLRRRVHLALTRAAGLPEPR